MEVTVLKIISTSTNIIKTIKLCTTKITVIFSQIIAQILLIQLGRQIIIIPCKKRSLKNIELFSMLNRQTNMFSR